MTMTPEPVFPDLRGMPDGKWQQVFEQYQDDREKWLAENGVTRITSRMKPLRSHEIDGMDCEYAADRYRSGAVLREGGSVHTTYLLMRVGG